MAVSKAEGCCTVHGSCKVGKQNEMTLSSLCGGLTPTSPWAVTSGYLRTQWRWSWGTPYGGHSRDQCYKQRGIWSSLFVFPFIESRFFFSHNILFMFPAPLYSSCSFLISPPVWVHSLSVSLERRLLRDRDTL